MAAIKVIINNCRKFCGSCHFCGKGSCYCDCYGEYLEKNPDGEFSRLRECLAAEGEIARLEEIEKEHKQWDDANCNECPISAWEACDEICQSKKTLIEKIAELGEGGEKREKENAQ